MTTEYIEKKAILFNKLNLIEKLSKNLYVVNPLKQFGNKTKHYVYINHINGIKRYECDCQWFRTTLQDCSHIVAVAIYESKIDVGGDKRGKRYKRKKM